MTVAITNELKKILFDAYNGFADKRVRDLDKGNLFIIDDRSERDEDARGQLLLRFCQIFAEVIDRDTVRIKMRGDVPESDLVKKWFAENGAEQTNFGLEFTVRRHQEDRLVELAAAFRAIVSPSLFSSKPSQKCSSPS